MKQTNIEKTIPEKKNKVENINDSFTRIERSCAILLLFFVLRIPSRLLSFGIFFPSSYFFYISLCLSLSHSKLIRTEVVIKLVSPSNVGKTIIITLARLDRKLSVLVNLCCVWKGTTTQCSR